MPAISRCLCSFYSVLSLFFCSLLLDIIIVIIISSSRTLPIIAQSVGHLTRKSGVLGSIPGLATYFRFSFRFFKKGSCQ